MVARATSSSAPYCTPEGQAVSQARQPKHRSICVAKAPSTPMRPPAAACMSAMRPPRAVHLGMKKGIGRAGRQAQATMNALVESLAKARLSERGEVQHGATIAQNRVDVERGFGASQLEMPIVSCCNRPLCGNTTIEYPRLHPDPTRHVQHGVCRALERDLRTWLPALTRRSHTPARVVAHLEAALFWTGCVYNFCRIHATLDGTPAMAAGLTEEVWSVRELLYCSEDSTRIDVDTRGLRTPIRGSA